VAGAWVAGVAQPTNGNATMTKIIVTCKIRFTLHSPSVTWLKWILIMVELETKHTHLLIFLPEITSFQSARKD
jgi:hypothetical protein